MSEVKRYEWSAKGMRAHAKPMGRYVQACDYDAAQAELSALREELGALKNHCADIECEDLREPEPLHPHNDGLDEYRGAPE